MKQKFRTCAVCLWVLSCVGSTSAWAANGTADPSFRFYSVVDGLSQSQVFDVKQDGAGYLWIATARGLNRFDGNEFRQYTIADGLPTNALAAIYAGENNSILAGDARGGITIVQGSRVLKTINVYPNGTAAIIDIEIVGENVLAVLEGVGIVSITSFAADPQMTFIGDAAMRIRDLTVHGAEIYAVGETGLYKLQLDNADLQRVSEVVRKAHFDAQGSLWFADADNQVGVYAEGTPTVLAALDTENEIVDLVTDAQGIVWAATERSLFKLDSRNAPAGDLAVRRFAGIDEVSSLFVDRENTIWLSSESRLTRFLGHRFQHYELRTGNDPQTVWAIAQDRTGRFWYGTQNELVVREHDESLTVIGSEFGVPEGSVRDVVMDANDDLWFSVSPRGLFKLRIDDLTVELVEATVGLDILDIDIAPDESIWFSTLSSGLFRYVPANATLTHFDPPGGASVYTLDVADDGSVWYGADDTGLVHLRPDGHKGFLQSVYGDDTILKNRLFNHITLSGANEAWVATGEGGLYHFRSGEFTDYGDDTPFADQTIYVVEQLRDGTVVIGGELGVYQFLPGREEVAYFNQLSGFTGMETNAHATFFDVDENLWFGTVNGATRMDTTRRMPALIEPTPKIDRAETGLDRLEITDATEVEPDQHGVHIEFAAVSLLNPKGIEYSYRMIGAEDAWSMATTNRSVSYPRLPPADYEFVVRARYPGGKWSQETASLRFSVLPHFWQETWFLLSVSLAILAALRASLVYRTGEIERRNDLLQAQVEERTRSIEDAKQRLQSSNLQLFEEIESRRKSDLARVEVETRFRRAFENAPIGMGLLDCDGNVFDANPALREMFWPDDAPSSGYKFAAVVEEQDRARFERQYARVISLSDDELEKKFSCSNADGDALQTLINLSPVRSDQGEFLYAVLQVQDITESLKLTSQLEYQASYDELTGLLNRRAFEAELQRAWDKAASGKDPSYLMFMDLDQFKVVNDTSGHCAGDELLKRVGRILIDNVRGDDVVARLGGDEFGLILWECPTRVARRIAESIRSNVEDFRFHWDAEIYRIGVSMGGLPVAQSSGDINELQQLADAACYAAKEAGRNRVHMVAGDEDSARVRRGQVRWVQRLREAMDNNRFAIYGQVIQPLQDSGESEQLEILLRLRDPHSRKLIPPGAFLPAAERYGLSVELDQWVVSSLLDTLFVHQAFQAKNRVYWINLSGTSVGDKRFAAFLTSAIKRSPLPPGTINFEITETAVIRSVAEAGRLMSALRDMGCKFALDDFGSGLSSFGYLKNLPVDVLKIDGMFIRDILKDESNRIFVKSIIDIARSLNIRTTAEFIENQEMLDVVRQLGADYAQGFAMGRPFELAPKLPGLDGNFVAPVEFQTKAG